MKVSREQVAENREAILRAAGRLFRQRGFEAVSVAEVTKAAGLTHGAFYGHFNSKDDLIAQTLAHLLEQANRETTSGHLPRYLSADHRDNPASGCPTAAPRRRDTAAIRDCKEVATSAQRSFIEMLSKKVDGKSAAARRRAAIAKWSAMVGAITVSRAIDDPELADEILDETRAWIIAK